MGLLQEIIFKRNNACLSIQEDWNQRRTQRIRGTCQDHRDQEGRKDLSPQVIKRLWAYLKDKNLQDPENKQFFTPDSTMSPIFGTERIKCFSMSKYLKEHLTNDAK